MMIGLYGLFGRSINGSPATQLSEKKADGNEPPWPRKLVRCICPHQTGIKADCLDVNSSLPSRSPDGKRHGHIDLVPKYGDRVRKPLRNSKEPARAPIANRPHPADDVAQLTAINMPGLFQKSHWLDNLIMMVFVEGVMWLLVVVAPYCC